MKRKTKKEKLYRATLHPITTTNNPLIP